MKKIKTSSNYESPSYSSQITRSDRARPANMRTVVISGASGFIGYNTVKYFIEKDCFVYACVNKHIRPELKDLEQKKYLKILKIDLRNQDDVNKTFSSITNYDAIIHIAGRASDVGWESEFRKTNFEIVKNLVFVMKNQTKSKIVFCSTTDVYGLRDFNGEAEDDIPYKKNPQNLYQKYKIEAEKYIKQHLKENRYCILRPGIVWGEGDTTITKRVVDFLKYSPFIIHFGKYKGSNIWPLVNVKTVSMAFYLGAFCKNTEGKAINVIDNEKLTVHDFYLQIAKKYFPGKKFKKLNLPMWLGYIIGNFISLISNIFNLKEAFIDPSYYAVLTAKSNLYFSSSRLEELIDVCRCKVPETNASKKTINVI